MRQTSIGKETTEFHQALKKKVDAVGHFGPQLATPLQTQQAKDSFDLAY